MADVFISYARGDLAFAERLAQVLEGLGLEVWWDRRLKTGDDQELEIERQLDEARAVIVLWSRDSVKSAPVRAEARRAMKREKLLPVAVEDVEPPLFSSGIQFEDLSGWTGDTAAVEFQDLFAQLVAMTGGVAAASRIPRDGVTPLTEASGRDDDAPILNVPWLHRRLGPFRSAATLLRSLLVLGFGLSMALFREEFFGPYWEGVFILAGTALLLFLVGERELTPNVKAKVARWLQPQPDAKPLRATAAFLALFEAVFSKRHLSFRCLWASALASVGLYAALLLLFIPMEVLQPLVADLIENGPRAPEAVQPLFISYVSTGFLEQNAALLFLAVPIANIVVDYFSLWETRLVLRWSARGGPIAVAVILDFLLTAAIFVALLPLGPVAFVIGMSFIGEGVDSAALATAAQVAEEIWRSLYIFVTVSWPGEFLSAVAGEANVPNTALLIAFFTTFTTSAWLWFALIFAPVVRFLSWTRRRGLSWIGLAVNIRQRPIAPLGYAAAGLILAMGALATGVAEAFSTKRTEGAITTFSVFRDCAVCPEMVALPGGSFVMGSPEDEAGREFDESPQTPIEIAPFAVGRFEVSFREWEACVEETAALPEGQRCLPIPRGAKSFGFEIDGKPYDLAFGDQGWGRGLRPVVTVNWWDTQVFIAWLNRKVADQGVAYRLLSEAEFEYAARAGRQGRHAFDGDPEAVGCDYGNLGDATGGRVNANMGKWYLACDDGHAFTAPIGSYRPNDFGLYDMIGNVWEWVEDCFHRDYRGRPVTGEAWTDDCARDDFAMMRGGSWFSPGVYIRPAARNEKRRRIRLSDLGFRVARTAPPQ